MSLSSFDSASSPMYNYNFIIYVEYQCNQINIYVPEQLNMFIINMFPSYCIDFEYDEFEYDEFDEFECVSLSPYVHTIHEICCCFCVSLSSYIHG